MSASPPQSPPDDPGTDTEHDDGGGSDRLLGDTRWFSGLVGLVLLLAILSLVALVVIFDERWGW